MRISRRNFLKLCSITGAGSVVPAVARNIIRNKIDEEGIYSQGSEIQKKSVCNLCQANCGVIVRIVNGKAVRISGDPENPLNKGTLCPKGFALLQEYYHPDRLRSPLKKNLNNEWEEISWEDALKIISGKI